MEPVEVVLSLRVEVQGQVTDVFASIGEEGDGLVGRHALGGEDLEQAPPGLGLDLLDEREALRLAVGGHALARDHLEPAVFAGGLGGGVDIAAVEPHGQWHAGAGQCVPVPWAAAHPCGVLRPEFGLQSGGDLVELRADPQGCSVRPSGRTSPSRAPACA